MISTTGYHALSYSGSTASRHALKIAMLASAAFAVSFPAAAWAQVSEQTVGGAESTEIVVTGSNIKSDNFNSSSPLLVLGADEIAKGGDTNVAEFLGRIPSIVGADTATSNQVNTATGSGLNTVALRNLGPTRTLVLVNGRRYVSGVSVGSGYGVDLNSIATASIKRVEVLTGGQSAAYGSDAVAGVINIITQDSFEGVKVSAQYGQTGKSDRETFDASVIAGSNFADGRGNAWISIGYSDAKGILSRDRAFSAISFDAIDGPDANPDLDTTAFIGSSFNIPARVHNFNGNGTPFTRGSNTIATSNAFNFNDFRQYISPFKRLFASARVNYELNDDLNLDLEANFARVDSSGRFEPIPLSVTADIFRSNLGGRSNINIDPALGPVSPLFAGTPLQTSLLGAGIRNLDQANFVGRRLLEFGTRGEDNRRQTFRIAGSLSYDILQDINFTLSGTYGQTTQNQTVPGDINLERARFAIDVVANPAGGYMCADALARAQGCVPFNPFAGPNDPLGIGISPAAIKYLGITAGNVGRVEQTVVSGIVSGKSGIDPFGAGEIGFAAGLEYRKEAGSDTPDSFRQSGVARGLPLQPTDGSYHVWDIFGEIKMPVFDQLTLDASVRSGDYSTVGRSTTWKFGFDAPVADFLRLRGAVSRAVRAPNIADLFAGGSSTAAFVFDPCDGITNATTGAVATNCRSIAAIQSRINSAGSFTLNQVERQNTLGLIGGSPNVSQETATSYTLGVVLSPQLGARRLNLAVDYYDIKIEDVIVNLERTVILNRCFAATTSFDPTCSGTTVRSPVSGAALSVNSIATNENQLKTRGVDVELSYGLEIGGIPGQFEVGGGANFLINYDVANQVSGATTKLAGEVLFPKTRFNADLNYSVGKFEFDWRLSYWGKTVDNNANTRLSPAFNNFGAQVYNDFRLAYEVTDDIDVQIGVRNAFDKKPPLLTNQHKYLHQGANSNGSAWDILGRRWFAGFNAKF